MLQLNQRCYNSSYLYPVPYKKQYYTLLLQFLYGTFYVFSTARIKDNLLVDIQYAVNEDMFLHNVRNNSVSISYQCAHSKKKQTTAKSLLLPESKLKKYLRNNRSKVNTVQEQRIFRSLKQSCVKQKTSKRIICKQICLYFLCFK